MRAVPDAGRTVTSGVRYLPSTRAAHALASAGLMPQSDAGKTDIADHLK